MKNYFFLIIIAVNSCTFASEPVRYTPPGGSWSFWLVHEDPSDPHWEGTPRPVLPLSPDEEADFQYRLREQQIVEKKIKAGEITADWTLSSDGKPDLPVQALVEKWAEKLLPHYKKGEMETVAATEEK